MDQNIPPPADPEDVAKQEAEGSWKLEVSPDGCKAFLTVKPKRLTPEHFPSKAGESEKRQSPLTVEKVHDLLKVAGITTGINWANCNKAAILEEEATLLIAEGQPPTPAQDAWVKLYFETEERLPVHVNDDNAVDYRDRYIFTSVKAGELLAEKRPGLHGTSGITVRGEIIPPSPPKEVVIIADKGVSLSEDGIRAIATEYGSPVVIRHGEEIKIKVIPCFTQPSDVDLSVGNIRFKGNIFIHGSVTSGVTIDGTGNIEVTGDVDSATIISGGNVKIARKLISATALAGYYSLSLAELSSVMSKISRELLELRSAIDQLKELPVFKKNNIQVDVRPLVKTLLEVKFDGLRANILSMSKIYSKEKAEWLTDIFSNFSEIVKESIIDLAAPFGLRELDEVVELSATIDEDLARALKPCDIAFDYALNSKVRASGDVFILGQGCYNSEVIARGSVSVRNVFRGGGIVAGGDVTIQELGAKGGTPVRVRATSLGSTIKLGTVWENCSIQIGHEHFNFEKKTSNIKIRLNNDEELMILKNV